VILRRVERAKQLLQAPTAPSLAEVASLAGFSDQASSPITSSVCSALRRGDSGCPQESHKKGKACQEVVKRSPYHCLSEESGGVIVPLWRERFQLEQSGQIFFLNCRFVHPPFD
jgi:hypothetical protein